MLPAASAEQRPGVDMTSALHKEVGNDEGLLRVVSNRACRHIGGDGLLLYRITQVSEAALGP